MSYMNPFRVLMVGLALVSFDANATLSKSKDLRMLDVVALKLMEYRRVNGELPIGSNRDITQTLKAFNSRITEKRIQESSSGELIDSKGRPIVILCSNQGWSLVGTLNDREGRFDEYVLISPPEVAKLYLKRLEAEDELRINSNPE